MEPVLSTLGPTSSLIKTPAMTEHQLSDSWASLAETTHDRIEEAEQRGDKDRANALLPVFKYCFQKAIQTNPDLKL